MLGKKHSFDWARAISAVCLSLLLSLASLAPLAAQLLNSSCKMSCCKDSKVACHRHGHGDVNQTGWTSAAECPQGCGQSMALPASAGVSLNSSGSVTGPSLQESLFPFPSLSAWTRPGVEFSLFERPPPFLG
jgi:hypothetical protein